MRRFFSTLAQNIASSFRGKNVWWHIVAIGLTAIIVLSGFDWYYFTVTRSAALDTASFPAVIIGGLLPLFGLPIMLLIGWLRKSRLTQMLAWALGQAAVIGWLISSFYKSLTGRIPPPHTIAVDISRQFNFGFLKEGIFNGWPSSHATVAFAMALALITLYPKNKLVRYLSFIYAFYIGIGVSLSIHWFSEFVAGAIMGAVIGTVVGKSFSKMI
jgi:membrane-associated phospholipid phosphatase